MAETPNALRGEPLLEVNDFGEGKVETGLMALALRVQALLLHEDLTYPNTSGIGVGVKTWSFEFLDDTTISGLRDRIKEQLDTYIPQNGINNVYVESVASNLPDNLNTIILGFSLGEPIDDSEFFAIAFQKDKATSKIYSKIVI